MRLPPRATRPSWGYMISKGATSIWERWDTDTQGSGMNGESQKILSGNLEAWFYQTLAGINYDPEQPGFRHILLRPHPLGDLTFARASYDSPHGSIISDWKIQDGTFCWNVTVPPSTTATVFVPTRDSQSVTESGKLASQSEGVRFLRMENAAAVYELGSGEDLFRSSNFVRMNPQ